MNAWAIAIAVVAFLLGFALSWWRVRRRLRANVEAAVAAEIGRQARRRIIEELETGEGARSRHGGTDQR